MMFNEKSTYEFLERFSLENLNEIYKRSVEKQKNASDYEKFLKIYEALPRIIAQKTDYVSPKVKIGAADEIEQKQRDELKSALKQLMPWRKGPFELFGIFVDAEWRSDRKWARLEKAISDLHGRRILDVGCGNGYYMFRMLGANAEMVLGVEPYLLSVAQFYSLKKFTKDLSAEILPLGIEELPEDFRRFDTVFSMGVFYHRRSPFDHLLKLRSLARSSGEVVLETLVIDGKEGEVLVPGERYAKMRNVWFIPSVLTLENWLKRVKFRNIRLIDVSVTTTEEQRKTDWMNYESLEDFLDKKDRSRTIEGYPAPKRAVFLMEAP